MGLRLKAAYKAIISQQGHDDKGNWIGFNKAEEIRKIKNSGLKQISKKAK